MNMLRLEYSFVAQLKHINVHLDKLFGAES